VCVCLCVGGYWPVGIAASKNDYCLYPFAAYCDAYWV
jgi:hypothetical protein